jgi:hypothetical protein
MAEHRHPIPGKLIEECLDRIERRHLNVFEGTFATQHIEDRAGRRLKIVVPVQIDHVVKIARARPLAERAHLLAEDFFIGVASDFDASRLSE